MPLRDDLLTPIPGADPGGPDLRNSPEYVAIEEARRNAEAVLVESEGTRTSEYSTVIQLASEFIATKSKDLQVAVWLTEALLRREGFGGFHTGLELTKTLLVDFWDHVHPRGEDGDFAFRAAPVGWIGASSAIDFAVRSTPLTVAGYGQIQYEEARSVPRETDEANSSERATKIKEGKLTPEQFHEAFKETGKPFYKDLARDVEAAIHAMQSLESVGADLFKDDAPSYLSLRSALSAVNATAQKLLAEKLELEPDPVEVLPDQESSDADEVETSPRPQSVSVQPVDAGDAAARIATAAAFLRQQDQTSPVSYLILRGLRWGELRARNGQVDVRMLAAPTGQMRTAMRDLELAGKWAELLEAGEVIMAKPQGRGWLDLQRYVLTACENLGAEYANVSYAIRGALADLLRDLPELPTCKMMDDFPTANPDTAAWLDAHFSDGRGAVRRDSSPNVGISDTAGMDTVLTQAKAAVRRYGPQKGIKYLMDAAERAESERERFLRTSQATEVMVENGLTDVALPILTKLVQRIDRKEQTLEEWESGYVIAQTLGLKFRCLPDGDEKKSLYERICRLDPVQAMNLTAKEPEGERSSTGADADSDQQAEGSKDE